MQLKVNVIQLSHGQNLPLPTHATHDSAGVDLYAAIDRPLTLKPMERQLIPTGIALDIPQGMEGQIRPRSGLAYKNGITVLNAPGTIDADYRGEVKVLLINLSQEDFIIEPAMRIAQLVLAAYQKIEWSLVEEFPTTQASLRMAGGFGSTGSF